MMLSIGVLLAAALAFVLLAQPSSALDPYATAASSSSSSTDPTAPSLIYGYRIVNQYYHDPTAYTQVRGAPFPWPWDPFLPPPSYPLSTPQHSLPTALPRTHPLLLPLLLPNPPYCSPLQLNLPGPGV
jgi:hypothetical protein